MRAFIAIDLPEELKEYLASLQKYINLGKFSLAKDFHLTLKFLDEISEWQRQEICRRLNEIKFGKFTAKLSKIGFFPDEKCVRVIWIGAEPLDKFLELHKKVEHALKGIFNKDDFVPHITLARVKIIDDKNKFLDELKKIQIEDLNFIVDRIKLKKSILTPEGPVYGDLEEFSFVN